MSNFEVQADLDNAGSLNVTELHRIVNILSFINPIVYSSVAEVKVGKLQADPC